MARCPNCQYPLPEDRERLGARCPNCRDPLYEPPGRIGRPVHEGEAACALHSANEAQATCSRCGNYLCEVCRSKWRGQLLCPACVNRALESNEAAPEQVRSHFRQAILSVCLGGGAWVVTVLAFVGGGLLVASGSGDGTVGAGLLLLFFLLVCAILIALFGVGQATAALRTRGNHMILATIGLILGGLNVGGLIGIWVMAFWQV
jgi:hypothetical protein